MSAKIRLFSLVPSSSCASFVSLSDQNWPETHQGEQQDYNWNPVSFPYGKASVKFLTKGKKLLGQKVSTLIMAQRWKWRFKWMLNKQAQLLNLGLT